MRRPRRQHSLTKFRRLSGIALLFLYAIVITGATVRLTGSGLGCPDWPSCNGASPVPAAEYHGLIEFGNRVVSFPTLVFSLWAYYVARRLRAPRPELRRASGLALAGVFLQIIMGGVTVRLDLHPLAVSTHFVISIAILACATFAYLAARNETPWVRRRNAGPERAVAAALVLACAVVICTGVLTTAAGPHSGALPGGPAQRLGDAGLMVALHARAVVVFSVLVLALLVLWRRSRAGARDLGVLAGLVTVQVIIGEHQYRNGLPWQVVLAHVGMACLVWIWVCRIAIFSWWTPGVEAHPGAPASRLRADTAAQTSDTVPA